MPVNLTSCYSIICSFAGIIGTGHVPNALLREKDLLYLFVLVLRPGQDLITTVHARTPLLFRQIHHKSRWHHNHWCLCPACLQRSSRHLAIGAAFFGNQLNRSDERRV
ncbi:hypothetical protein LguiA_031788 [Lonicera macranthoides]